MHNAEPAKRGDDGSRGADALSYNFHMNGDNQRAIEAIDRSVEEVRRLEGTPIVLDPAYLAAIDRVERMPQNQSGADKTWLWEAFERDLRHFSRVVRR